MAIPVLLEPLHKVIIGERMTNASAAVPRDDGRAGTSPVMVARSQAGLTTTDVAIELGCTKPTAYRYLVGQISAPAGLYEALERLLTGDAELAREIIELIPSRQRLRLTDRVRCAHRASIPGSVAPGCPHMSA